MDKERKIMKEVSFKKIDVFTQTRYKGNPVAVIFEGDNFSTNEMQMIANWMNLSETTFICKPTNPLADYKLRIFSPQSELSFAGHPTVGSAFAYLQKNPNKKTKKTLIQECGIGLIPLSLDNEKIYFSLPKSNISDVSEQAVKQFANALDISTEHILTGATIDIGASWITLQLVNGEMVKTIQPNIQEIADLTSHVTGLTIFGFNENTNSADIEVRSFAPNEGANEDPVCGSGNGCVAILIQKEGLFAQKNYVARQGICLGRDGRIYVEFRETGEILVGGSAVECVDGVLKI